MKVMLLPLVVEHPLAPGPLGHPQKFWVAFAAPALSVWRPVSLPSRLLRFTSTLAGVLTTTSNISSVMLLPEMIVPVAAERP